MGASAASDLYTRTAQTPEERHRAFRLRYEVYIEEQGKAYADADHANRLLSDELDVEGAILIATQGDAVVGTVRSNWFDSTLTRSVYADVFQIRRFAALDPASLSTCSRLSVGSSCRRAEVARRLLEAVYRVGLARGTTVCFATCVPPVLRIFRRYGSREYAPPIIDAAAGTLHRTALVLDDLPHLEQVGSPLLAIARMHGIVPTQRPWLDELFEAYEVVGADA